MSNENEANEMTHQVDDELAAVLDGHAKWLKGHRDGKRADLQDANRSPHLTS